MQAAIYGYGNIGKGVELAIRQNPDIDCFGIFTRRPPESIQTLTGVKVYPASEIEQYKEQIDVLIICGGSATDLPTLTPFLAKSFNVVDSFDTHARIPQHFAAVDAAAKASGKTALISGGWDPGLFSLARLYSMSILPEGSSYTFWGRGVSQGHSDAIRHIEGVQDARQYTVPVEEALQAVRSGQQPTFTARQMHTRECYVVAKDGADMERIAQEIKEMPNYFAPYDTSVTFVSQEELREQHAGLPHGGMVIRSGKTGLANEHSHTIEYKLTLDSNPEFTAGALVAMARAVYKLHQRGETGCKTVFDVPPADFSPLDGETLRAKYL